MTRLPSQVVPHTLTFLIEESRVMEAEAMINLLAQGNGHATQQRLELTEAWRAHLREHVVDLGDYPMFPLLYMRNNQVPRAIAALRTEAGDPAASPLRITATLLEMLRLLWLKRRIPLLAFTGKLKRDRVHLITEERFVVARDQLFAAGFELLEQFGHRKDTYLLATGPQWVVYPLVRDFLAESAARFQATDALPGWWDLVTLRTTIYSTELLELRAQATRIPVASDLEAQEAASLTARYARRIARLEELALKEAERATREAAYLDSIREDWLVRLNELAILERSPRAWREYQDFRDRYTPMFVGTAGELLARLPREATYTVWEVGQILPFTPRKTVKVRPPQGKIRKVNPDEVLSFACPSLEYYTVEEGIRQQEVVHYVVLRLKDEAWALFNCSSMPATILE